MSFPPVLPVSQALPFTVTVPMVVPAFRRGGALGAPPLSKLHGPTAGGGPPNGRLSTMSPALASSSKPWWVLEVRALFRSAAWARRKKSPIWHGDAGERLPDQQSVRLGRGHRSPLTSGWAVGVARILADMDIHRQRVRRCGHVRDQQCAGTARRRFRRRGEAREVSSAAV
jgi:hypothetical protein